MSPWAEAEAARRRVEEEQERQQQMLIAAGAYTRSRYSSFTL